MFSIGSVQIWYMQHDGLTKDHHGMEQIHCYLRFNRKYFKLDISLLQFVRLTEVRIRCS